MFCFCFCFNRVTNHAWVYKMYRIKELNQISFMYLLCKVLRNDVRFFFLQKHKFRVFLIHSGFDVIEKLTCSCIKHCEIQLHCFILILYLCMYFNNNNVSITILPTDLLVSRKSCSQTLSIMLKKNAILGKNATKAKSF